MQGRNVHCPRPLVLSCILMLAVLHKLPLALRLALRGSTHIAYAKPAPAAELTRPFVLAVTTREWREFSCDISHDVVSVTWYGFPGIIWNHLRSPEVT